MKKHAAFLKQHGITPVKFWHSPIHDFFPMLQLAQLLGIDYNGTAWLNRTDFQGFVIQLDLSKVKRHGKMVVLMKRAYSFQAKRESFFSFGKCS